MNTNKKIVIYGAKSLDRYTKSILIEGFRSISWKAEEGVIGDGRFLDFSMAIFQIHGAPQANEDEAIINMLKKVPADKMVAVLIHRPDEVKIRFPDFGDTLSKLSQNMQLVFLGDKHIKDEFFNRGIKISVIPHGFFDFAEKLQKTPIFIGTHTTWGEMRSTEHMLRLLAEIFKRDVGNPRNIWGYIGGKPAEQLQIDVLKKTFEKYSDEEYVNFLDVNGAELLKTINNSPQEHHVILVDSKNVEPKEFGITFNVQLYYLGNSVRTGESSGSIHMGVSVPVILEMNGAENIENLKTIRMPYGSLEDIGTIDFASGAQEIISKIDSGDYVKMLEHNLGQARKFNKTFVAECYAKLFV